MILGAFLRQKLFFPFPEEPKWSQMEPNGAKIEPKVSPKLLKNEAKIDFKNQLKFKVVFYWFSVIFHTILDDFSTLKLKMCKNEKSENKT